MSVKTGECMLHPFWHLNAHEVQRLLQRLSYELDDCQIEHAFVFVVFVDDAIAVVKQTEALRQTESVLGQGGGFEGVDDLTADIVEARRRVYHVPDIDRL